VSQNHLLHRQICTSHSNEQSVAHTLGTYIYSRFIICVYDSMIVKVICDDEIVRFFFIMEFSVLTMLKFQYNFFNFYIELKYKVIY